VCVFVCVCVLANVLSLALSGADGRTALQLACAMGRAECVQVLLDHGATVDTADDSTFFGGRCWVLDSLVPAPSWFNGCPQGCSSRPLCVPPAAAGQGCRSQQGFPRRGGRALDAPPCGRTKQPHPMRPALARERGTDQRCNQTYNPAADPPFVIYLAGQRGSRHCASRSRTAGSSASSC